MGTRTRAAPVEPREGVASGFRGPLHLSLALRPVGTARPRQEVVVSGYLERGGVVGDALRVLVGACGCAREPWRTARRCASPRARPPTRCGTGRSRPSPVVRAREAANLSRMRSPLTSRSSWAKLSKMFSVSRPIEVVLKLWVMLTKVTPCISKLSTSREKSISERERRSIL